MKKKELRLNKKRVVAIKELKQSPTEQIALKTKMYDNVFNGADLSSTNFNDL